MDSNITCEYVFKGLDLRRLYVTQTTARAITRSQQAKWEAYIGHTSLDR
jgi:hypothetical protein